MVQKTEDLIIVWILEQKQPSWYSTTAHVCPRAVSVIKSLTDIQSQNVGFKIDPATAFRSFRYSRNPQLCVGLNIIILSNLPSNLGFCRSV